jgi:hypothetical protein
MTQGSLTASLLSIASLIVLRMHALMAEFPLAATKKSLCSFNTLLKARVQLAIISDNDRNAGCYKIAEHSIQFNIVEKNSTLQTQLCDISVH